ncbi:MAG: YgfZ/GcvT domain-containing protein, partial [Limisphaerales bacterium]
MNLLLLHGFHQSLGAGFSELSGQEIVAGYGDELAEYRAIWESAGILDFSFRGRICLTGSDRVRFLHGQVTNDVKQLQTGEGCYAAITNAKGRMESDLNVFNLSEELLLDFEPGLTERISGRLERFIVADDVQIVNAAPHYGLLTVQGPKAMEVMRLAGLPAHAPLKEYGIAKAADATAGEIYAAVTRRLFAPGFDIFIPNASLAAVADQLTAAARSVG